MIFRGVELCRLGVSSGYHSYYFIYSSKLQWLGLSNTNKKHPPTPANTSKTLDFLLAHVSWDWGLCRTLSVRP